MKTFYIKQKLISLRDNFHVYDMEEQQVYEIEGNLIEIPKTFVIRDRNDKQRAIIKRKLKSFLPAFHVKVEGQYEFVIKKHLSIFKSRYSIAGEGVEVDGSFLDMEFEIKHKGKVIGTVRKEWLSWGDTYQIDVLDDVWEMVIITLVVAIDRVKDEEYMFWSLFDL